MDSIYSLFRGGQSIPVEKDSSFFTAILPTARCLEQVNEYKGVQECSKIFKSVYRLKADAGVRDELMSAIRTDLVSHHAYHPVGDTVTRYYLTDLLVVRFQAQATDSQIEGVLSRHGLQFVKIYDSFDKTFLLRVTRSAGKNPVKLTADLHEETLVAWAEPNLVNRFAPAYTPSDELFKKQWHLKSWQGVELDPDADVRADQAWDLTRGNQEITVAVIDDGFDLGHPDFAGKIVYPKDFADGDTLPTPSREKGDYHGTPCAGVAIGAENGKGIVGAAPGCAFLPIRFDLAADDNTLLDIFTYAGQYADVISCSWGPVPVYAPLHQLVYEKFSQLAASGGPRGKGAVICFAAGNFNAPISQHATTPFKWRHPVYGLLETPGKILNGNAAHPDVLAIAASNSLNKKSLYSNWGKEIALCAPSDNWNPLDPQVRMPGRGIWTADNETTGLGFTSFSQYTGDFGGTSSATPLVAGVAALVRSLNPDLTAAQVRQILKDTADKITDTEPDRILGNKKGTYDASGHSEWFGYGKVNAFRALQRAAELAQPPSPEPLAEGVRIVAALINPKGLDALRETATLANLSDTSIKLKGWSLTDNQGRNQTLPDQSLEAGQFLTIPLKALRLSNRDGFLELYDDQKRLVHRVSYTVDQVPAEGWTLLFR